MHLRGRPNELCGVPLVYFAMAVAVLLNNPVQGAFSNVKVNFWWWWDFILVWELLLHVVEHVFGSNSSHVCHTPSSSQVLLYHLHYILSAVPKLNFPVKTGGLARSKSYQAQETGVAIFEEATRSLQSTSAENMPGRSLCFSQLPVWIVVWCITTR